VSSSGAVPLGQRIFGVRYLRAGTVEGSHTPLGEATLYIDDEPVGSRPNVKIHPGTFGLAGASLSIGRNSGSAVSSSYKAPFDFTGGTINQVVVDVSGQPYEDVEKELALAFAKD
jgi:arylsulfatase